MHARAKLESLAETNRVAVHRDRARSESESSASRKFGAEFVGRRVSAIVVSKEGKGKGNPDNQA
jgi:hypothetical protein